MRLHLGQDFLHGQLVFVGGGYLHMVLEIMQLCAILLPADRLLLLMAELNVLHDHRAFSLALFLNVRVLKLHSQHVRRSHVYFLLFKY